MPAIEQLWNIYCDHETTGQGYLVRKQPTNLQLLSERGMIGKFFITQLTEIFFKDIICYGQTCLTDPMLKLIGKLSV